MVCDSKCCRYEMTTAEYRALLGETGEPGFSSSYGKLCKRLYRARHGRDPNFRRGGSKKRTEWLYPCHILEAAHKQLRPSERPYCARHELPQKAYRALRGEKWSPGFISTFGWRAARLYEEQFGAEPNSTLPPKREDRGAVNLCPYGILETAYKQLRDEGVPIGEPYVPDPEAPKAPNKRRKRDRETEAARAFSSASWARVREVVLQKMAQRVTTAAANGGRIVDEDDDSELIADDAGELPTDDDKDFLHD